MPERKEPRDGSALVTRKESRFPFVAVCGGDALRAFARARRDRAIAGACVIVQIADGALNIAVGQRQGMHGVDGGNAGVLADGVDAVGSKHGGFGWGDVPMQADVMPTIFPRAFRLAATRA